MGESEIKSLKHTRRLWALPVVLLLAQQSYALGLGELRVQSYLGEPLRGQVELLDLGNEFESSIKVKLASPEEYRKAGLAYPYDKKYSFELINEDGRHPKVKVRSLRAIEDPYLNILIEVIAPTGMFIKNYTVLIDPSPDYYRTQAALSVAPVVPTEPAKPAEQAMTAKPVSVTEVQSPSAVSATQLSKPTKHKSRSIAQSTRDVPLRPTARYKARSGDGAPHSDKLSLSLSTSLTISSSDPTLPMNPKETSDALQEELIAKEKTLQDLNAQIAEMQTLIKGLQIRLSMTAGSGIPESGVPESGIAAGSEPALVSQVEPVSAVSAVTAPVIETGVALAEHNLLDDAGTWYGNYKGKIWSVLALFALSLGGYHWWRKRKLQRGWIPGGLFDDLAAAPLGEVPPSDTMVAAAPITAPVSEQPAPQKVAVQKLAVGEQSMKVPAFKEQQKAPSTLPPEYDLLEEANIYLRFGHDKLAEEVLQDALKINPKNPDIYLTLLGIFDTRNDAQGFEKLAKEFKVIADEPTWSKVSEMGRKLDLGNSLYAK